MSGNERFPVVICGYGSNVEVWVADKDKEKALIKNGAQNGKRVEVEKEEFASRGFKGSKNKGINRRE